MTSEQREQVANLRRAGMPCVSIAKELRISVNTVKSYCLRHSLQVEVRCKQCGAVITSRHSGHLCSDGCRIAWWEAHHDTPHPPGLYPCVCVNCGKNFYADKPARLFCSFDCYIQRRFYYTPPDPEIEKMRNMPHETVRDVAHYVIRVLVEEGFASDADAWLVKVMGRLDADNPQVVAKSATTSDYR